MRAQPPPELPSKGEAAEPSAGGDLQVEITTKLKFTESLERVTDIAEIAKLAEHPFVRGRLRLLPGEYSSGIQTIRFENHLPVPQTAGFERFVWLRSGERVGSASDSTGT